MCSNICDNLSLISGCKELNKKFLPAWCRGVPHKRGIVRLNWKIKLNYLPASIKAVSPYLF